MIFVMNVFKSNSVFLPNFLNSKGVMFKEIGRVSTSHTKPYETGLLLDVRLKVKIHLSQYKS